MCNLDDGRAPNWHLWKQAHEAQLYEAIALSLNIAPEKVQRKPGGNEAQEFANENQEFRDRLFIARRNRQHIGVLRKVVLLDPTVNLQLFARWAVSIGWQLPDLFVELAMTFTGDAVQPTQQTMAAAARQYIAETYPSGIPAGITNKMLAKQYSQAKSAPMGDRTMRRARKP